jgi:hypothetical protein
LNRAQRLFAVVVPVLALSAQAADAPSPSVPDAIAYRLLLRALGRPGELPAAIERAQTLLAGADLSDQEIVDVVTAAREFASRAADFDRWTALVPADASGTERRTTLRRQRAAMAHGVVRSLPQRLGPAAFAKLRVFCETQFKQRIRRSGAGQ